MSSASGLSSLRQLSQWKVVGGLVRKFLHASSATQTEMKFSIFLPPSLAHTPAYASGAAKVDAKVPALYWLSGLTCTDDNFMHKAAAFRAAAAANVALICPDTSPRGANLGPEEKASWDFGEGAGFYLNATSPTYAKHYNMHDYVVNELPQLIEAAGMGVDAVARRSIFGHSMGGHGALVAFLRPSNKGLFRSVSAFAPIAHPSECDWGRKAFKGYLGDDTSKWSEWDATSLVSRFEGPSSTEVLIDQGAADEWLTKGQLNPDHFVKAAEGKVKVNLRSHEGYDHSYYFIQTFVEDHINFHAKKLHEQ